MVLAAVLAVAIALPWLVLIERRSPGFLAASIGHDVVGRVRTGHEGHVGPPGYYLLTVWATFFPWCVLLPGAVWHAWRRRGEPTVRFALAAVAGPWFLFEIVAGKLPHYLLPTFPAMAVLVADFLLRASEADHADRRGRAFRFVLRAMAVAATLAALAGIAFLVTKRPFDAFASVAIIVTAMLAVGVAWTVAALFVRHRVRAAALAMGGGAALLVALAYGVVAPRLAFLQTSRIAAEILAENGGHAARGYMIGYKEPSLAFYQGGGLREQRRDDFLNASSPDQWPPFVVASGRVWDATRDEVKQQWTVLGTIAGFSYNERGRGDVVVLKRRDGDAAKR